MRAARLILVAALVLSVVVGPVGVADSQEVDPDDSQIRNALSTVALQFGAACVVDELPVPEGCAWLEVTPQGAYWAYDLTFYHAGSLQVMAWVTEGAAKDWTEFWAEEPTTVGSLTECTVDEWSGSPDCRSGRFILGANYSPVEEVEISAVWDDRGDVDPAIEALALLLPEAIGTPAATEAVSLRAIAPGYGAHDQSFGNSEGYDRIDVAGSVIDGATGEPVHGATIQVINGGAATAVTTGADGRYEINVDVNGGSGTGRLTMDFELPPLETGLQITVEPPYLAEIGEEAVITVTVLDPSGAPVPETHVTLTGLSPGAEGAEGTTDASGSTAFEITHTNEVNLEYRYRIEASGRAEEVVVPAGVVRLEPNPLTGRPFLGVAADGVSALGLEVGGPGLEGWEVTIETAIGQVLRDGSSEPVGSAEVVVLGEEAAAFSYVPPEYLQLADLDDSLDLDDEHQLRLAEADIFVTLRSPDGSSEQTFTVLVGVVRPPVFLVHGFIGNPSTWANLDTHLRGLGFDTDRGSYSGADPDTIGSQESVLDERIDTLLSLYREAGFDIARVDVIGHSMGGLIARSYVKDAGDQVDVRKVLMVGTPNHGVRAIDESLMLTEFASSVFGAHREAAVELYPGSAFMSAVNAGERYGHHLRSDVEYANLFGWWTGWKRDVRVLAGSTIPMGVLVAPFVVPPAASDGVVSVGSARLNGVESSTFPGVCHSAALPSVVCDEPSITEDRRVWDEIERLLLQRIFPGDLADTTLTVKAEGTVELRSYEASDGWRLLSGGSSPMQTWEVLRTGADGRALVTVRIAGRIWGTIALRGDSEILIDYVHPDQTRIMLRRGSVRVESAGGGEPIVDWGPDLPSTWFEAPLGGRATGMGTAYVVTLDVPPVVEVLEGTVLLDRGGLSDGPVLVEVGSAAAYASDGQVNTVAPAESGWWVSGFYETGGGSLGVAIGAGAVVGLLIGALVALGIVAGRSEAERGRRETQMAAGALAAFLAIGTGVGAATSSVSPLETNVAPSALTASPSPGVEGATTTTVSSPVAAPATTAASSTQTSSSTTSASTTSTSVTPTSVPEIEVDFVLVTDGTGTLSLDVPVAWSDLKTGVQAFPRIVAAQDADSFENSWDLPGLIVELEPDPTAGPGDVLGGFDLDLGSCAGSDGPAPMENPIMRGLGQHWWGCGGISDAGMHAFVGEPPGREFQVIVVVRGPIDEIAEAFETAVRTVRVTS